jgi:hypothetical protein
MSQSHTRATGRKRNNGKPRPRHSASSSSSSSSSGSSPLVWLGLSRPPLLRARDNQVFSFIQNAPEVTFTQTAVSPAQGAFVFKLSYLTQAAQLVAVFDQYRIAMVEITFRPMFTANPLTDSPSISVPQLYTVVDYDDVGSFGGSVANALAFANCTQSVYETVVRRFVPHVAVGAWQSGSGFAGYANETAPWLDCASSAIEHYGVKYICDPGFAGQTQLQSWVISSRYLLCFRNVR